MYLCLKSYFQDESWLRTVKVKVQNWHASHNSKKFSKIFDFSQHGKSWRSFEYDENSWVAPFYISKLVLEWWTTSLYLPPQIKLTCCVSFLLYKFVGQPFRNYKTYFSMFLDFIPFGYYNGDVDVAYGYDGTDCFSVSKNFPLFTKKNHRRICVSFSAKLICFRNYSLLVKANFVKDMPFWNNICLIS